MQSSARFKRPLLFSLIGSVIAGALLGIFLVLQNSWGWLETRVMLTTIIIAGASLCGLACDLSRIPRGPNILPRMGLVTTCVSAFFLLTMCWDFGVADELWRITSCLTIFAVATVHVCLLSIARLRGNYRWVFLIAMQLIYGLAALLIAIVLGSIDSPMLWRFIAVLSITIAALTLVIPILYRLCRSESDPEEALMPNEQRNLAMIDDELDRLRQRIATLEKLREDVASSMNP